MKKVLLIMGLLLIVTIVNSYNYPNTYTGRKDQAYYRKTLEIMYDSKKDLIKQLSIVSMKQVCLLLIQMQIHTNDYT